MNRVKFADQSEKELENDLEELMLAWFNVKLTKYERKAIENEILQLCAALGR